MNPIGLDTETWYGKAVLLCSPDRACTPRRWSDVEAFLFQNSRWVVWNLTYDGQAILAWIPRTTWRRLATLGRTTWNGLAIRWVPGKFLELRRGRKGTVILDAMPFYQCSLQHAAKTVLGDDKADPGVHWTEIKQALRDERRDALIRYCQRDAWLAERLYTHVSDALRAVGPEPRRPVSPASWSRSVFRKAMPRNCSRDDDRLGRRIYFGGRIECFRRGYHKTTYQYDIRSAYPYEEARLLDLRACSRVPGRGPPRPDAAYGVYRVRVRIHPDEPFPLVPVRRKDESIIYPVGLWDTWTDVDTARVLLETDQAVRWGAKVEWIPTREVFPFREGIERLYALRSDPSLKQAAKLVMNALYGALAERRVEWAPARVVGTGRPIQWIDREPYAIVRRPGRTAHVIYAAHVTARTRLRLWRALQLAGSDAIFVHTDSIACRKPIPLPLDETMGAWSLEANGEPCIVIGSGIYGFPEPDGSWDWTTRGFGWRDLTPILRANPEARSFTFEDLRAESLKQLARAREPFWDAMNVLADSPRELRLDFDHKRCWSVQEPRAQDLLRRSHGSLPWYWSPLLNREA